MKRCEIASFFKDKEALKDLQSYMLWKNLGFPRANWEECPNRYVQVVNTLKPLDDMYHPPIKL